MEIAKVYEPQRFEPRWANWWVEQALFRAEARPGEPYFSLAIPPPNVTGSLHMGHMFEHAIIDALIRWHRMKGENTLWLPGTDHAGIATELMVDRQLASEGVAKRDLGREKFVERVWQWKAQHGGRIQEQMKRAGVSCDWSRERFTLDQGLSRAVREAFVRLYEKGLIYRGDYMVNWCPRCRTVLSDLEVEHQETEGNLWHIVYPVIGSDLKLVVATTRPETMLGDTGVALHPSDKRAEAVHLKSALLPLMNRPIPIVLDAMADPEFGSGAVKITPAHDPNDFEAGKRHDLASIQVIGDDARMTAAAGPYAGLDRFEARVRILDDLKKLGLLEKVEEYQLSIGKCHRCKTIVEPSVSKQWWMKMKPLAEPAIQAVEDGRITFVPANWAKTYFEWMYNIRDWCISRQLWWGHRIPAWHCGACGETIVARQDPAACALCGSANIAQDPDVLDTWFSSGLWPFSTLGWPHDTEDLRAFYPTSLLVTGFDIIFFWVARMIMFGLEMMGDVPFRQVHIHGIVRDAERVKMSKTKGNTIDPLVVMDQYGTDAVRLALLISASPGADVAFGEERLTSARNFANKLWNASRLLLSRDRQGAGAPFSLTDRWIAHVLNECVRRVNAAFEDHRYHEAADDLWHFWWDEFCDWYLELKKLDADWSWSYRIYETALRLLHPLMPFLTEELWHRLGHADSIALARYPQPCEEWVDREAAAEMQSLQRIVVEIRKTRADNKVDQKQTLTGELRSAGRTYDVAHANLAAIAKLAGVTLTLVREKTPGEYALALRIPSDRARLEKEIRELTGVIAGLTRQLENQDFLAKAPEKVVASMRQKVADYEAQIAKNRAAL
jgi:valyl-tRNA synthetase